MKYTKILSYYKVNIRTQIKVCLPGSGHLYAKVACIRGENNISIIIIRIKLQNKRAIVENLYNIKNLNGRYKSTYCDI